MNNSKKSTRKATLSVEERRIRVEALVGPLSARERCNLFGRMSKTREEVSGLKLGPFLPELPPIELDESLHCDAEGEDRLALAVSLRRLSKNRGGTNGAGNGRANA